MKRFDIDKLWILLVFFTFLTIIVYFTYDIWAVQVLSACLGAIITIIATRLLLSSQSKIDEKRREEEDDLKREFEIYNAKLKVYSDFVSKMYGILSDNEIEKDEMLELRSLLFGQVSFFAKGDILKDINSKLEAVDNYTDILKMQRVFTNIACILQKDLRNNWPVDQQSAYKLWETFDKLLDNSVLPDENNGFISQSISTSNSENTAQTSNINRGFWHFAMWGAEEQIKALREGVYELNLVEYNEEWRTNLIKQVQKDDLIFLFRSGGWGYMGVYRAIGWRIFEFEENNNDKETIHLFTEPEKIITDKDQLNRDLEKFDIYNSKEDGASLCSSIIVEPLAFARNGIGNPGGVYRRTISRYYHEYGMKQLARFMAIMDNAKEYNVHYNGESTVDMGCNKEAFKKILDSSNIQPAARDENGNWINS